MVQAGWRRVLGIVLGVSLLGAAGCGSGRSSTRVDEEWLARVPPAQMEEVRKARLTQSKAMEETVRAEVSVEDARRELEVARQSEEAAKSRMDVDEAALAAAREKAQGAEILQAQRRMREGELELAAAQAEVDFQERKLATREALEVMRARELAVADAEVAQAEYQALVRSGDIRARQLDGQEIASRLAEARRVAWETQKAVDANLQVQRQARARWERLEAMLQGYGGSGR